MIRRVRKKNPFIHFYQYGVMCTAIRKNYEFYVNGQTGKAVGEAPTSTGKIIAWFIAVFGSLFFTVEMLLYLLGCYKWQRHTVEY